ncbi:MAG: glycosyltransferase family 1 protein, partial [Actinobacteria bacterium]|nr:glycosyltransferase family 1 protein [Actinomycetota bacterium]
MRVALDVSAIPDEPAGAGIYVLELVKALDVLPPGSDLDLHLVARNDDGERWHSVAPRATV